MDKEIRVIDTKFHIENNQIIKTSSNEIVPEEEPLILFRARDYLALPTLRYYGQLCQADGATDYQMGKLQEVIDRFVKYSEEHPEMMKQPGITRGAPFVPGTDYKAQAEDFVPGPISGETNEFDMGKTIQKDDGHTLQTKTGIVEGVSEAIKASGGSNDLDAKPVRWKTPAGNLPGFLGFAPVKNWDPLLKAHDEAINTGSYSVTSYKGTCCTCQRVNISDRYPVRGCPECRHQWCENCTVEQTSTWRTSAKEVNQQEQKALPPDDGEEGKNPNAQADGSGD